MVRFTLVFAVLASSLVFAQSKSIEDKRTAAPLNEIERGFYLGANGGFWGTIVPPGAAGSSKPFLGGQAVEVELGYDLGERVSAGLFFLGAMTNRAGSDYKGFSGGTVSGDFGMIVPGATAKVRIVGFSDSQEVQRSWFYVRVSAGYVFYSPTALIPKPDVLISAGPGVEYFTRLRHFSIGVEANFNFLALTSSVGFSILPTVRYAF
jgi:hypothetical protein